MNRKRVVEFQKLVAAQEKVAPCPKAGVSLQRKVGIFESGGVQLMELHGGWELTRGLVVIENSKRRNNGAAPRRHLIDVKEKPIRKEKDLRRNGGKIPPGKLSQKGQV